MEAVTTFFSQNISSISEYSTVRVAASVGGVAIGLLLLHDTCWHSYYGGKKNTPPNTSLIKFSITAFSKDKSVKSLRILAVRLSIITFSLATIAYSGFSLAGRVKTIF